MSRALSTALAVALVTAAVASPPTRPLHAQEVAARATHPASRPHRSGQPDAPSAAAMAMLPMATTSAAAKMHATLGQRALDMGRPVEATQHFAEAVAADSSSATAQLGAASVATSFADYDARLAAAKAAEHASRAEQLQVAIARKALAGDLVGAEASARELVAAEPRNPRSFLALASVQQQMGREAEARKTMERAIAVAPAFSPAYLQLAFSYMVNQPTDAARARPYVERLVALEPKEPQAFIAQRSFYRATNQLPLARGAYSRAAELGPDLSLPLQQRGHVESFLGHYDAARADYDAAMRLGKQNEPASVAMYRALVAAHAGNPAQAITELDRLAAGVDGMHVSDPLEARIAVLTAELQVAVATGDTAAAARAVAQRTPLVRQQVAGASDAKVRSLADADVAYYDGLVAARQGDAATARAKADENMFNQPSVAAVRADATRRAR